MTKIKMEIIIHQHIPAAAALKSDCRLYATMAYGLSNHPNPGYTEKSKPSLRRNNITQCQNQNTYGETNDHIKAGPSSFAVPWPWPRYSSVIYRQEKPPTDRDYGLSFTRVYTVILMSSSMCGFGHKALNTLNILTYVLGNVTGLWKNVWWTYSIAFHGILMSTKVFIGKKI
jgi:hypothetical protein